MCWLKWKLFTLMNSISCQSSVTFGLHTSAVETLTRALPRISSTVLMHIATCRNTRAPGSNSFWAVSQSRIKGHITRHKVTTSSEGSSEGFLGFINSSDQPRTYAASEYFTTWQNVKSIFGVSSHTEAPAQGLRTRCALISLVKNPQEKHVFCPTEETASSVGHVRVINLWDWRRKWLNKALPMPCVQARHSSSIKVTSSHLPSWASCL